MTFLCPVQVQYSRRSNLLTNYISPQASAAPSSSANTTESNATSCAGTTYNIKPADDCYSISTSQRIGTGWLLTDNNLQAYCADFPKSGSLCLVNRCDVYTLRQNDTCSMVAANHSITETQLKAWNPVSPRRHDTRWSVLSSSSDHRWRLLQSEKDERDPDLRQPTRNVIAAAEHTRDSKHDGPIPQCHIDYHFGAGGCSPHQRRAARKSALW